MLAFSPCLNKQLMQPAGTDVLLLHCVWHVHLIILWIHRRAALKNFSGKNKSTLWLRELVHLRLTILKTTYCIKNDFVSFQGTMATFYRWGGLKRKCLLKFPLDFVYHKLVTLVHIEGCMFLTWVIPGITGWRFWKHSALSFCSIIIINYLKQLFQYRQLIERDYLSRV